MTVIFPGLMIYIIHNCHFQGSINTRYCVEGGNTRNWRHSYSNMPGVGLMVRVVGFGSSGPELKSCSAVELIPGGLTQPVMLPW